MDVNCFCNIVSPVTDQCFLKKPVVTPDSGVRGHDRCTAMPVQHVQAFFVLAGLTNYKTQLEIKGINFLFFSAHFRAVTVISLVNW